MTHKTSVLAEDLRIGPSQIYVKDLRKMTEFYSNVVGLEILSADDDCAVLGYSGVPILDLLSKPNYKPSAKRSAGLYHNAIVFKTRSALAATLLNILQISPDVYQGSADHNVSEAFYFQDPENNGLELYFDRPESTWEWRGGFVKMGAMYLDPQAYILENVDKIIDKTKKLGHIHLKVGDISTARQFYVDTLGFDVTFELSTALFVSVGGYHHHVGMNTWESLGAGKREQALGMGEVKFVLPKDDSLSRLLLRLGESNIKYTLKQEEAKVEDPWGNQLVFVT